MKVPGRAAVQRLRPLRRRAEGRVKLLASRVGDYHPMAGGRDALDAEYRAGHWDYLVDDRELPRFGIVAAYCLRGGGPPSVLEIGCGEGLLPARLGHAGYERYVGVDVSHVAVERARAKGHPRAEFHEQDASTFEPDGLFDVILLNEVLEYFSHPVHLMLRYERWLEEDGRFIVSQFRGTDNDRTRKIWRALHEDYDPLLYAEVTTGSRLTWRIEVLPRSHERRTA